jgi:flavin-dependent dehydrogenase
MNKPLFSPWFKRSKVVKEFAAAFNLYSPIIEPYDNRVLIVGDAGSCVDLENTGAMISGWKAGQAISTAIQEENLGLEVLGINQYVNWWKEEYIRGHSHDDMMRGVGLSLILSTEEEISYLNSFIKETLPATWHPSAAGKHAGRAMTNAWAIIEKERPDIYQKLQKRKLPATEIYADLTRICRPI